MKNIILLSILFFAFTALAGNIISSQPLPSPSPSPAPLISPSPLPSVPPLSALENRRNLLLIRLKPQIDAYKTHHQLINRLFPGKDEVPSQGQLRAAVDPTTVIAATNAALGAVKESRGLIPSFVGWCADCVNDIQTRHSREERRAVEINKLCVDMSKGLEVTARPDVIQGVVDHYWQDGGKKKWTEVAKYFVKKRKEPAKGFITFLLDHTVDNNDFANIEYLLPYIFNEIDTYLASPKYRKSADPRKDNKT